MRRRMKEKLTFLAFVLAYGVIFAAMTWLRPRWLGLTIFAVGCTFFLLLGLWYVLGVLILLASASGKPPLDSRRSA